MEWGTGASKTIYLIISHFDITILEAKLLSHVVLLLLSLGGE